MPELTRITPRELLLHMEVPEHSRVYLLGCLEKRVTVYSQQVRALNLIYALRSENLVEADDEIAIIGGGVAGLTAAAAAAREGLDVTVLEKDSQLLHVFRGCDKRWLHPRVYDWPAPGSLRDDADLPVLTWSADRASTVVERLLEQWQACRDAHGSSLRVHTGVDVDEPEQDSDRWALTWRPGWQTGEFKVVILAAGFGIERGFPPLPAHSYWHDDGLELSAHSRAVSRASCPPKRARSDSRPTVARGLATR